LPFLYRTYVCCLREGEGDLLPEPVAKFLHVAGMFSSVGGLCDASLRGFLAAGF